MEQSQLKITDAGFETAKSILELATNAKSLWKSRTSYERKEFLNKLLSNQTLDGQVVKYEMKKPFKVLSKMAETPDNQGWRRVPKTNWLRLSR